MIVFILKYFSEKLHLKSLCYLLIFREGNALAALQRVASNALDLTGIFHCEITPEAPTPDSRYISFHHLDNNSEGYWNTKARFMSFFLYFITYSFSNFSYYNNNLYAVIKHLGSHLETIRHLLMSQS